MKKSRILFLLLALTLILSSVVVIVASATESPKEEAPYEYVVVLGVDALGTFGTQTNTPNIDAIFSDGAKTNNALVENPSASAQGWGSLLIGVSADVHGLTNYSIMDGAYSNDELPTIFKLLKDQNPDAKMVSYCSWNSINNGIIENINGLEKKGVGDAAIPSAISNYFSKNGAPNLLFCQFNQLDATGHSIGYGTPEFLEDLEVIDGYIGDIYEIYENAGILDKTLFIVTGDHGGINTTHGGWTPEEKYVFYGVAGKGVNEMSDFDMFIRDTPAIVTYALGLKGTEGWDSYVPEGLFEDGDSLLKRPPQAPELVYPDTTPEKEDEKYIGNYIDIDELKAGFFFDGDLSNFVEDSDVELGRYVGDYTQKNVGTIYYPSGLYSESVRVSYEGYLATEDLHLDNNSFSIGLWVSLDEMSSAQLVWSTKRWTDADGVGNFNQQGFLIRNCYVSPNRYLGFNMGSGNYSVGGAAQSPTSVNYYYDAKNIYTPKEWVHTLMVVDRDAKTIKYYVNFELAKTIDLSTQAWFADDYDVDPHGVFMLGQDITGAYPSSLEGNMDDLLIWNTAIDKNTVASLKEYYNDALYDYDYAIKGEPSVSTSSTDAIKFESGVTNTDNTPFTKIESTILSGALSESAKYSIANGFSLSDYEDAKYYVVDFDIATASNYLPMNFVTQISGDKGSASLDSSSIGITADGVLIGNLNGVEITRTLTTSPYVWQHITLVYDLVGGDNGYPLYIYFNGDLINNTEWIDGASKESGELPSAISATELVISALATADQYYATTLVANATSALYIDDTYGNIDAFFTSGASMKGASKVLDLVYSGSYVLPASDYIFSSKGVGYRSFADAINFGNGVIDVLHNDLYTVYNITDPCVINTNGYVFNFEFPTELEKVESTDSSGNKVYTFESEPPIYTLTYADGTVKNYYTETPLKDILTTATTGSTIKLFADIEVGADYDCYSKTLNIDLNGYTVTNSGGHMRIFSGAINVYGGKIVDSNAKEFIYIGAGASSSVATITNCTITADRTFAEVRCGTVNLVNCTYTHTGNNLRFANCASGSNLGDVANVKIDGCTMNLGSALLVSAERASSYDKPTTINITINNSEIKTTSKLFHLKNTTAGAADSVTNITVTGESKLAFATFDGGGATVPDTTVTFGPGVMFSAEPTVAGAKIAFSGGADKIIGSGDANYPYIVGKSDAALYSVKTADGVETKYYEVMGLRALIGLAPSGSTITLYADIDLSETSETFVTKTLIIDLNGHRITNTGERIRVENTGNLTLKNGILDDCGNTSGTSYKDKDYINIPNGANGAVVVIDNCEIIANGFVMDIKGGSVTVKNSTFTQGGKKASAFVNILAAGSAASVTVENCDIDLGSAPFIRGNRADNYPTEAHITVTVKDTTIKTTGKLMELKNTVSGDSSSNSITFTGKTYLTYASLDGGTCTVSDTTVSLGDGVKMSAMPTLTVGSVKLCDGGEKISETDDTDFPYVVTKEDNYLYTVTTSAGVVTKYYEVMGLRALVGLAPSGSTITLYADIDLSETSETFVTKTLIIDLNGYRITNTGERLSVDGSGNLTLKNGILHDTGNDSGASYKDNDFLNIRKGASSAVLLIENCEIISNGWFMDVKAGSLTVKNSTFVHGGKKEGAFVNVLAAGDSASITVEGCEIELGAAPFIRGNRASSYTTEAHLTVSVTDTAIKTTGKLMELQNTVSADSSSNVITFTGNTSLTYNTLDGATCTVANTTVKLGRGVKMSAMPTLAKGSVVCIDSADEIKATGEEDYPYEVAESSGFLYAVTTSGGVVTRYYEVMGLQTLVGLAPAGSTITLYADIDLSHTSETIIRKTLIIDLNGHKITNTGERLKIESNGNLTLKNGTLDDCGTYKADNSYDDNDFITIPANQTNATVLVDNCDIIGNGFFIDAKSGSVTVKNSTFVQGGKKAGAFAYMLAAGASASLTVEKCEIAVGSSAFVTLNRAAGYATEAHATVTVRDTTITTTGSLFALTNTVSGDSSSNVITFTGETYLKFASFDGNTCGVTNTTVTFGNGVKVSNIPTVAKGTIAFTDGGKMFAESDDASYPYEVIDGEICYTVTLSSGKVINIYKATDFDSLVALADNGSVIKLFKDIEISAILYIKNKNIELDLNGHTITSNVRMRPEGSTNLYIHDGKIVDGAADFVFIGAGNASVVFKIESCEVSISGKLLDARAGKVEAVNSTFKNTNGNVFLLSSQGTYTSLVLSECTFDLGSASFVSTSRGNYSEAANTDISMHNCVVNTTGPLFYLPNEYTPDTSKIAISITGDETKLSYGSFDGDTCTVPNTTATIGLGVKMNKLPSLKKGNILLGEGARGIAKSGDAECPYVISEKASLSAKPYFSLTLYSDFTLNLCFRESEKDYILKVVCGDVEIEPYVSNGMVFYPIKNIAAYNAAEIKEIEVTYLYETIELEATLNYSVIDYANGLLASEYSIESKELLCRAIDYVKSAYEYASMDVPTSVSAFIASDAYKAISTSGNVTEIPASSTDVGKMNTVIQSAQINLDSELRFRFNIKSGANANLTIITRTQNETFEIVDGLCNGKSYIVVKMRAFDMYDGVITMSTEDASGTYDLKAYANSGAIEKDTTGMLDNLLLSLYNYCREANEYARVQDKDFNSSATIVVKDGKAGTVTYVVDDGRADSAARLEPMLDKYENLKLTFGLIANKYATLSTQYNAETGKYEYVFNGNGKYVYTTNEEAVKYWVELLEKYPTRVEYSNHSYSHVFAGYDDEGGTVSYVDTSGNIKTVTLPVGSATAELYAARQIFYDLFGVEVETLVQPGVAANRTDVVIDGVTYKGYLAYYFEVVDRMYDEGILVGSRGDGFGEASLNENFLVIPENFASQDQRLNIQSFTMKDIDSFDSWKRYIDYATASGGWANFCLHQIFEDGTVSSAFHLKESQAHALFNYTNRDEVWVANYAEACKYYAEWATAEVSVKTSNGAIKVTLTDAENNEVYDEALTVKVTVPNTWETCLVNGTDSVKVMTDVNGASYVYVNIVPDSGVVTLTSGN